MSDLIRTLHETVHYPAHPPRKPTKLYKKTHKQMIDKEDGACHVCGVSKSTLHDPAINKRGSVQMELHHYYVEDSLANAISLDKFNMKLIPYMAKKFPRTIAYKTPFTQEQMLEWIHGDRHNCMILCSVCHRSSLVGIHAITYPIWFVQDLIMDNFDLTGFKAATPQEAKALTGLPTTKGIAETLDTNIE